MFNHTVIANPLIKLARRIFSKSLVLSRYRHFCRGFNVCIQDLTGLMPCNGSNFVFAARAITKKGGAGPP